jgi:hypothetical protein
LRMSLALGGLGIKAVGVIFSISSLVGVWEKSHIFLDESWDRSVE